MRAVDRRDEPGARGGRPDGADPDRGAPRAYRASSAGDQLLHRLRCGGGPRRRRAIGPRQVRRAPPGRVAGYSARAQGCLSPRRRSRDLGYARVRRADDLHGDGDRPPGTLGGRQSRPPEPRRIRRARKQRAFRPLRQSLEPEAHLRRLLQRAGGRGRRAAGGWRARLRCRRLHTHTGGDVRGCRPEAYVRPGQSPR